MKGKMMKALVVGLAAGVVIYLVRKKIMENNKRNVQKQKNNNLISRQRRKFPNAYGEYTL